MARFKEEDFSICPLRIEDAELILSWRNKKRVRKFMYNNELKTTLVQIQHNLSGV